MFSFLFKNKIIGVVLQGAMPWILSDTANAPQVRPAPSAGKGPCSPLPVAFHGPAHAIGMLAAGVPISLML
jgi:hypothetical protein